MTIEQEARAEAEMRLDENAWMFRGREAGSPGSLRKRTGEEVMNHEEGWDDDNDAYDYGMDCD